MSILFHIYQAIFFFFIFFKSINILIVSFQVSTHGYSQNQILVWRYPSLAQVAKLTGHTYRVLYLAMSPDGEAIVTGAGDETLRFWNVFSKARSQKVRRGSINVVLCIKCVLCKFVVCLGKGMPGNLMIFQMITLA